MTHYLIDLYFCTNLFLAGYTYAMCEDEIEDLKDLGVFMIIFIFLGLFGSILIMICILVGAYSILEDKIHAVLLNSDSWWIPVRTIYFVYFTKEWDHNPEFMPDTINPKIEAARQGGWRTRLLHNALVTISSRVTKNTSEPHTFTRDYFSCRGTNQTGSIDQESKDPK